MEKKNKIKVVVGLSGGVDSNLALFLLKKQGYQPIGVSLKFSVWPNKKNLCRENLCCTNKSFYLARKLCQRLNTPHYLIDCQKEFEKIVINYFIKELKNARTPNPCVVCNQKLRFPKLFELAKKFKAKYVATGHYARKNLKSGIWNLESAVDASKDQTYFLYTLKQKQLAKLIFPLGNLTKEEVKKIAEKEKIEYSKKESQDFCFVANQSLVDFLKKKIGEKPGPIYDSKGNYLGTHLGLHFYTLGQRRGLNLGKRYWVLKVDKKRNALIVTENMKELFGKELIVKNVNWISGQEPKLPIKIKAKIRYKQKPAVAIIDYYQKPKVYSLRFKIAQRAITPGQSCVFYQNNICLGGGVIINGG